MLIRVHTGVTLDGFSAGADGWPAVTLVPGFVPGVSHEHPEFFAEIDAVIVGRTTYDYAQPEHWPWPGKRTYVLTSRPLTPPPGIDVVACDSADQAVKSLRESGFTRDAQLLGGPSAIRAFHAIGAIDRLEIVVLPVLAGTGTPLFPLGPGLERLQLTDRAEYGDGSVKLCYSFV